LKIFENVFVVPKVVCNPYIIIDADGLTIIDTGFPRSEKKILAYVTRLGRSARDVTRILLTHSDLDHVGALPALQRATGARTYASRIEAEAIAAGITSRPIKHHGFSLRRLVHVFSKPARFRVDEILMKGDVLPILGGLSVVDTAGHSPGHLSFFAPAAGILFCGDSMVTSEKKIHGSRPQFTWDEALAKEAVVKQAALGARIVCPAHGPVVLNPDFSTLI
jgi:glyoxylase-like metal-dependent hydrolase (beta-lactamase superfamily II)